MANRRPTAPTARQKALQRSSTAQQARNPMLAVRVPRALYRSLLAAAKSDHRTLADWMRLNLPRLLEHEGLVTSRITPIEQELAEDLRRKLEPRSACESFKADENDERVCQHCGWREDQHT